MKRTKLTPNQKNKAWRIEHTGGGFVLYEYTDDWYQTAERLKNENYLVTKIERNPHKKESN